MSKPGLVEQVLRNLSPAMLIAAAVYHFAKTVLITAVTRPIGLFNISNLREQSFASLWTARGAQMSLEMPPQTTKLIATVHGRVLDIGPGSGTQLVRFDPSKITECWGAEPAEDLLEQLKISAIKAGFGDKYKVLHCGGEPGSLIPTLAKQGLLKEGAAEGIFDDIVCLRVLCGVPHPRETVHGLYRLLKPGGRLVIHEHVVNPWQRPEGSVVARFLQFFFSHVMMWSFWLGNCCIDRDTEGLLRSVGASNGGWESVKLEIINPWASIPYLVGELTKKR